MGRLFLTQVLDRHQALYIDQDLPWGLHLWKTARLSLSNTPLPLLINENLDIFPDITSISLKMYSQAFSGRVRLYQPEDALRLQTQFDTEFAPAVRRIMLAQIIASPQLSDRVFHSSLHLKVWREVSKFAWPLTYWAMRTYYRLGDTVESQKDDWTTIKKTFDLVDGLLGGKYMLGDTFSAADISFSAHAALLLLPPLKHSKMQMVLPELHEVSELLQSRIVRLRDRPAGKYALRMLAEERGESLGVKTGTLDRTLDFVSAAHLNVLAVLSALCVVSALARYSLPGVLLVWGMVFAGGVVAVGFYDASFVPNSVAVVAKLLVIAKSARTRSKSNLGLLGMSNLPIPGPNVAM